MWHEAKLEGDWFKKLTDFDEKIARTVAAAGCRHCGGPLHRGDYKRKPRGSLLARAGEAYRVRYSLCCGREGCRKRALPPSLRFLGRRVYLEAVVLLATVCAMISATLQEACWITDVPVRTLRRWRSWWTDTFPKLDAWIVLRAHFVPPPPDEAELPKSVMERAAASLPDASPAFEVLELVARWLAPLTTRSVPDGSRFVHTVVACGGPRKR